MKKIDLHVHSKFSEHPSEWFLQRLGAAESYTEPETIYQLAKERGMDFVTITDHNKIEGALLLKEKYPKDVIVGLETTAYFPEDGCKVHILLFGIDEKHFQEIEKLRENIYDLRDWIKKEKIAYSVSHPTYSVNGRLKLEHLEKLILLFDVFEGINGGRNALHNDIWVETLKNIDENIIEELYSKYKIEPISDNPWIKSFTGGSDDHAGIFIGKTYTLAEAETVEELLECLKRKKVNFGGQHNDFKSLAFTVFKVAYDYSKSKSTNATNPLMATIIENLLNKKRFSLKNKLRDFKINSKIKNHQFADLLKKLVDDLKKNNEKNIEEKLDVFYENISNISDEFIKIVFKSFEKDLKEGDFINIVKTITSSLTGIFLSVPFFSSFKHLNQDRNILDEFIYKYNDKLKREKHILWFTDTIDDLNGVSVTLKEILRLAYRNQKKLFVVSSTKNCHNFPPNFLNLPSVYEFVLPYYEQYVLKIPSVLKSLKLLEKFTPDEIYISTPGPVGLFGLLMSKIYNVKSIGVFHTDFVEQSRKIVGDESLIDLIDTYIKWFYSCCDRIDVPSNEYIKILQEKGFDEKKLRIFKRGIDLELFSPKLEGKEFIRKTFGLEDGLTLLYVGRISKDKNINFLLELYKKITKSRNHLNLLIVGDGPYKSEIENEIKSLKRVVITGKLNYELLPYIYSGADLFLFPSTTDTFGMVVLEAQACGLPVIVSDKGGPKNIIKDGETGFVAKSNDLEDWFTKTNSFLDLIEKNPSLYYKIKHLCRKHIENTYRWEIVLSELFKF